MEKKNPRPEEKAIADEGIFWGEIGGGWDTLEDNDFREVAHRSSISTVQSPRVDRNFGTGGGAEVGPDHFTLNPNWTGRLPTARLHPGPGTDNHRARELFCLSDLVWCVFLLACSVGKSL